MAESTVTANVDELLLDEEELLDDELEDELDDELEIELEDELEELREGPHDEAGTAKAPTACPAIVIPKAVITGPI